MARRAIFNLSNGQKVSYEIEGAHPSAEEMAYVRQQENDPDAIYHKPFGALSNIAQSLTLNQADEIMGGVGGAYEALTGGDFSEGYQRVRDAERERLEMQRTYNPAMSRFLEIATPMGVAGLLTKAPAVKKGIDAYQKSGEALGPGLKTARNAGTFGLLGGLYGLGESTAQTPAEIATDAMYGAGMGAALPAVGTPLLAVSQKVGGLIGSIARPFIEAIKKPKNAGANQLREALEKDQIPVERLADELEKLGPEATVADLSIALGMEAANVRNLLRRMRIEDGDSLTEFTTKFIGRDLTAQSRLQDDLADLLGFPSIKGLNVVRASDEVKTELAKMGPQYEEVMENTTIRMSDVLRRVLNKPAGKDALRKAKTNMDNEGIPGFNEQMELDGDILKMTETPTLRTLDQVKRSLDERINQLMGGNVADKNVSEARRLMKVRKELVDELDRQSMVDGSSVYKEVRDNYAPGLEAQAALDRGFDSFGDLSENIMKELTNYGEAGKKAFQFGAARKLLERINSRKEKNQAWSPTLDEKEKIKIIFGKDADAFIDALEREASFNMTKNAVLKGSVTADKQQDILRAGPMQQAVEKASEALTPDMNRINPQIRSLLSLPPRQLQQELTTSNPIIDATVNNLFNPTMQRGLLTGGGVPSTAIGLDYLGMGMGDQRKYGANQ